MIGSTSTGTVFRRPGITLTEILIAIMILGVGLVSLATLFPIGLLRLRDATRYTRSALLLQSAAADASSRGLFQSQSLAMPDYLTFQANQIYSLSLPFWYSTPTFPVPNGYNPLIEDTQFYGGESHTIDANTGLTTAILGATVTGSPHHPYRAPGLPFAYDPLWRYQTVNPNNPNANGFTNQPGGYYLNDKGAFEARFGNGIPFIRPDPTGGLRAHGLQRITTFNRPYVMLGTVMKPFMPASVFVPSIFVSQEDVVWQDPEVNTYTVEGQSPVVFSSVSPVAKPSPLLPDLNTSGQGTPSLDWRYSWMFTGQLTNASNASSFDGSIVILENRPFAISSPANLPYPKGGYQDYQVEGETVVEAVFGYSSNIVPAGGPGYGTAADRTVLLRWPATMADPVVRVGDWIADVTYERNQVVVYSRRWRNNLDANGFHSPLGVSNPTNNGEWDNLPPQRCCWYRVQKLVPPTVATGSMVFGGDPGPYRYMIVQIDQPLVFRTVLNHGPHGVQPVYLNAALIAPNVVNVIPQSIFVRSSTGTGQ